MSIWIGPAWLRSGRLRVWLSKAERFQTRLAISLPAFPALSATPAICLLGDGATGPSRIDPTTCVTSRSPRIRAESARGPVRKSWLRCVMQRSDSFESLARPTSPSPFVAMLPKSGRSSPNWVSSISQQPCPPAWWRCRRRRRRARRRADRATQLPGSAGFPAARNRAPRSNWLAPHFAHCRPSRRGCDFLPHWSSVGECARRCAARWEARYPPFCREPKMRPCGERRSRTPILCE